MNVFYAELFEIGFVIDLTYNPRIIQLSPNPRLEIGLGSRFRVTLRTAMR